MFQEFEEEKYLRVAIKCGEAVWERGLTAKGYSICHGVSGNAYTFLQLYQITKVLMRYVLIFSIMLLTTLY